MLGSLATTYTQLLLDRPLAPILDVAWDFKRSLYPEFPGRKVLEFFLDNPIISPEC